MLKLKLIIVKDSKAGYTCWLKEFPSVLSEGDSEKESIDNLFVALQKALEYKAKIEEIPKHPLTTIAIPLTIIEKTITLEVTA